MEFHNSTVSLNNHFYDSHKNLIMNLCIEFGASDRIGELTDKFLGKKVKMKAMKDPDRPKRAKSAFFYFCEKHRPKLMNQYKKKGEKVNIGEVTKKLGLMWGKTKKKPSELKPFEVLNEKDRARWESEMESYKMTH